MPELPEVEIICRGLARTVIGRKITNVRIALPKVINTTPRRFRQRVKNAIIRSIRRRAKIIIINLSGGFSLGIHLKISGQLLYAPKQAPVKKHTHIIFDLNNGYQLRFVDPRQFGYVKIGPTRQINKVLGLERFGPEPLEKSFTRHLFQELIERRRNGRIKPLLMNQGFIAGLGNIYADEVLFYARIHPLRQVGTLSRRKINNIYTGIKRILLKAIKYKGTSVDSYVEVSGRPGNYERFLKAYGREGEKCLRCKTTIKRIKIGSRSAYFCPSCQVKRNHR